MSDPVAPSRPKSPPAGDGDAHGQTNGREPAAPSLLSTMLGLSYPAREPLEAPVADLLASYCRRCGATGAAETLTDSGCGFCRGRRVPWWTVRRIGAYRPPLSEWIIRLKFQRQWALAEPIGAMLAERLDGPADRPVAVVPVPLHWTRRLGRGYDQARLLAEVIARRRGWTLAPVLRRQRRTPRQSMLTNHAERVRNVRRAFACQPVDLSGWAVWLVDDVITTGATAAQAARLLKRAGAAWVGLAVAAVADPHGGDFQHRFGKRPVV